jgi:hypothetical protein
MSQSPCAIDQCKRTSRALCHCCNQNICLLHLKEHYDKFVSELNPLTDEINLLDNRLITIDIKILTEKSRQQLEQWRNECYQTIDRFFEEKYQELEELIIGKISKQKNELSLIRTILTKLIEEQEASQQEIDLLKTKISQLNENLKNIEHLSIHTTIHPLSIDNNTIEIIENLHFLPTLSSPCKTIDCSQIKSPIIASNEQFLLFHEHSYLCLIDQNFKIIKKLPWNSGQIQDICWSSTINRFILTIDNDNCGICFVHDNTISSENTKSLKNEKFHSCTCSNTSLFLSTDHYGSAIMEYRLLPSIELIKQWKSPDICAKDEYIDTIRYNNDQLGLLIQRYPEKILNLELRSAKTFDRIWSIQIDIGLKPYQYGYCLLNNNNCLLINKSSSCILHITNDGKIKETCDYNPRPVNATLFGQDTLAILTENNIQFHKI